MRDIDSTVERLASASADPTAREISERGTAFRRGLALAVGGLRMDSPDEARQLLGIANESLRRLGEPCFTREAVAGLRHEALTARQLWAHYEKAGVTTDAQEEQVAWQTALADLIESILPPDVQLSCPDCGQPLAVSGEAVQCSHGLYVIKEGSEP